MGTGHRVPMGHSRLDSRCTAGVHESMDGLDGAVVVAHVLVRAATSMGTLALQGPGQADWVPIVLRDDVQRLTGHHQADGGVV